ncbi:SH3 domain-containing protein [Filimonas effusa]|uniref:SH3 domain-containing protein n=1 Tax=Filimonas effusa TaxID=2508721 RepID=A0A4Q1D3G9_9BACT|nr:SH3 domain-containing protein [Filimonas effusa]RXK81952.1 SH3 domain-containing protein [Filimonas effusa]
MKITLHIRQLCLLLTCLFTLQTLSAQDYDAPGSNLYATENKAGDTLTILADTTFLRDQPAASGKILQQLPNGTQVVFVKEAHRQRMKGFSANWIRVRVAGDSNQEGFIWKGLTTLGCCNNGNTRFLYGLDRVVNVKKDDVERWDCMVRLKVVNNENKKLADVSWPLKSSEATSFSSGKLLTGSMGLEGLTHIVRIYFSGEACGIPDDYFYFGWTGAELLPLPGKMHIADAGVYYHSETLLFPSESGGKPGHIIKLIEEEEALDEMDKDGEPKMKKTSSGEQYKWDGRKAVKL